MRLFDLKGDIAFVTGAGSGIGQSIAIGLAEAGADIALFGREQKVSALVETAARVESFGRKALVVHGSSPRRATWMAPSTRWRRNSARSPSASTLPESLSWRQRKP